MQLVMKITLRRTWYTSVLYLSYLFSFLFPITTAFMNHFLPLTYRTTSFSIVIFSTPAFLESFSTIFYPPYLLSQSVPSRYSVLSFTIRFAAFLTTSSLRSFFSSYTISFIFFYITFLTICFLPSNFQPFFFHYLFPCNRLHYPFFIYQLYVNHLLHHSSPWLMCRPIRSPISLPHYSFSVSLFASSRNLITKTADTRHESDKQNHISEAKFSKSLQI